MLKQIHPKDYSIRPFKAHKLWSLNQASSGVNVYLGEQLTGSVYYTGSGEYSNNIPKKVVFDSINHLFYKDVTAANMLGQTAVHTDTTRSLSEYCHVISIPTRYFGEEIKPTTVTITDSTTGRTYVDDGHGNLIDNATSSAHVGNVIYPYGLIIATNTSSFYSESFIGNYTLGFRSTVTIYENEVFLEIEKDEFNVSQNPTAYITDPSSSYFGFIRKKGFTDDMGNGEIFYNLNYTSSYNTSSNGGFADYEYSSSVDPTGSFLAPYITAIGLYNDDMDMVAVAKLTQPIKSLPDLPINFIIRFDT